LISEQQVTSELPGHCPETGVPEATQEDCAMQIPLLLLQRMLVQHWMLEGVPWHFPAVLLPPRAAQSEVEMQTPVPLPVLQTSPTSPRQTEAISKSAITDFILSTFQKKENTKQLTKS